MRRIKAEAATAVTIILQGNSPHVPAAMPPSTGLLVWSDGKGLLSYWNDAEWNRLNAAGFAARFNATIPDLSANSWAIVVSPRLAITAGSCFREFNTSALMWALHFVPAEEVCRKSHEFLPAASDQQDGDPERIEVDAEVDAYLAEHGYRDALPLK